MSPSRKQSRPGRDRSRRGFPRDILLVLLGSGLAFLGTCMGQIQQAQITRAELRAAQMARLQESASALLNEVSRDLALIDIRLEKVTWAGLSHQTDAVDSLARLYRDALDTWRLSEPRYLAQMAALFGVATADLFRDVSTHYTEHGNVVVAALQAAQPDSARNDAAQVLLQDSIRAVVRAGLADHEKARANKAKLLRALAFAIRDEEIGLGKELLEPEVDSLAQRSTGERSLAHRLGLPKSPKLHWWAIAFWLICGALSLVKQRRSARQPISATVSVLLGPVAWLTLRGRAESEAVIDSSASSVLGGVSDSPPASES
jgi:hypothetical protein